MSKEDLIHLKKKGDPYSDSVRAKLVGTASEKRKQSAIIRGLRMANPETIQKRAMELVANPNTSAIEIMRLIQEMLNKEGLSDALRIQLIRELISGHTAIHGSKAHLDLDAQVKAKFTFADAILDRLKKYKEEQQENGNVNTGRI